MRDCTRIKKKDGLIPALRVGGRVGTGGKAEVGGSRGLERRIVRRYASGRLLTVRFVKALSRRILIPDSH